MAFLLKLVQNNEKSATLLCEMFDFTGEGFIVLNKIPDDLNKKLAKGFTRALSDIKGSLIGIKNQKYWSYPKFVPTVYEDSSDLFVREI